VATSEYVKTSDVKRYSFTQYVSGSLAAFKTAFAADWAAVLPAGFEVVATVGAPTIALCIVSSGQVLTVNPNDWVGFNYGSWLVVPNVQMSGSTFIATSI